MNTHRKTAPSRVGGDTRLRAAAGLLFLTAWAVACAPVPKAAEGEIGDQVTTAIRQGTETFDHSVWNDLAGQGAREGLADYDFFFRERDVLEGYLASLEEVELATLSRDELLALLINAYNTYTIQSILEHPDVSSIKEIDGVWDKRTHRVGGHDLTLDNIEHNLIRPYFKDPRIHAAVNCASMSCAALTPWAFTGSRLDGQLEAWTEKFFNDPRYVRIEGNTVYLSRLLDWYGNDFVDPEASPRADSVLDFAARYNPRIAVLEDPQISFMDYDWSLNRSS